MATFLRSGGQWQQVTRHVQVPTWVEDARNLTLNPVGWAVAMTVRSATVAAGALIAPLPIAACLALAVWAGLQRLAWRLVRGSLAGVATVDPVAGLAPSLP